MIQVLERRRTKVNRGVTITTSTLVPLYGTVGSATLGMQKKAPHAGAANTDAGLTNKARSIAMSANGTLPDSFPQSKSIPVEASDATLRSLASAMELAFSAPRTPISRAQRIVELSGGQWLGLQKTQAGPLAMFRDPVSESTCALAEEGLTVKGVQAKLESKRTEFGMVLA